MLLRCVVIDFVDMYYQLHGLTGVHRIVPCRPRLISVPDRYTFIKHIQSSYTFTVTQYADALDKFKEPSLR